MIRNKWIFIISTLLALLLVSGCNRDSEESTINPLSENSFDNPSNKQSNTSIDTIAFMEMPKIKIITFASVEFFEIEVNPDMEYVSIPNYANEFIVKINFDTPLLNANEIEKHLELFPLDLKYQINVYEDNILDIRFQDVKENEQYSVKLKKNFKNINEDYLEKEINLTIKPVKFTEAIFKVIGNEEELIYEDTSFFPAVGRDDPQLTNEPKKIEISFTNEVNKTSVEKAIHTGITEKDASYTLEWTDNKTLLMNIISFHRIGSFIIPTIKGLDNNGFIIYNNFYFTVDKRNELYSYDLEKNASKLIKIFDEKRYTANYNPYFNKYLLLADNFNQYIFDREASKVKMLTNIPSLPRYLGMGPWTSEVKWVDENTVIYFNYAINSIVSYSFKDKTLKPILDLSNQDLVKKQVFHMVPSPDGLKFALVTFSNEDGRFSHNFFHIYVYSMEGRKLFENNQIDYLRKGWVMGSEVFDVNLDWLNNDEIIYEAGTKDNGEIKINIVKSNIYTNRTTVLVDRGFDPKTCPRFNAVIMKKYDNDSGEERKNPVLIGNETITLYEDGQYQIHIGDEKINFQKYSIYNLFLIDNNRVAYNRMRTVKEENLSGYQALDLIIYNFRTDEEKVIGQGKIVGTSPDGRMIYFMTNQQFLLPVT